MLLLLLLLWGIKRGEGGIDKNKGYSLTVEREIVVQEGLCILVPCKFSYPKKGWSDSGPIHGHWFRKGSKPKLNFLVATNNPEHPALNNQSRFFLFGDPWKNNCSLGIRGTRKEDRGSYFFRLERGKAKWSYINNTVTLHVTDLTYTPHVLIPETLEAGRPSNLTCSAPWACEPPTFSWTGTSVSGLNTNTINSSVLTIIPQPCDHGTNLTCQVTLPLSGVTTRMTIRLNVSYAPKNLTVTICQGADSGSAALSGMTTGAFVGAGATTLLFLICSVIFLMVRSCRRRPARPAAGAPDPDALQGSVSQSPLVVSQADDSSETLPSTAEAAPSSTEEEIHYATLIFQGMKPRNPQGQQDTATEYSEIRSHK